MVETQLKYKPSELGPIPEDWIESTFGEVLKGFSSGMTPYRGKSEYYTGDILWITSGELNYNVITDTEEKITPKAVLDTNLKLLPPGTFLMAITGLEAVGTRGSCAIVGAEATTNQSCMALFGTNKMITEYLFHFYVNYGEMFAFKYCQGSKQQSYTGKIAKLLPVILPPTLEEQKAIATALSDTDELIASLEKLIVKKKAIKQGTMQQLLTPPSKGGKRLPGFSGEWLSIELGDYADITKLAGFEYSKYFNSYLDQGEIIVIRGTNITHNKLDFRDIKTIPRKTSKFLYRSQLNKGDLVFAYVGTIGPVCLIEENDKFHLGPNTAKISSNYKLDEKFLLCLFKSQFVKKEIDFHTSIGAQPSLSMTKIRSFNFHIPDSIEEQKAIAAILNSMENEIEALESKKAKYEQVKQGMMQELLTGKTRLV